MRRWCRTSRYASPLAFQAFFGRIQAGETPGSRRFRGTGRSDRIPFAPGPVGCRLAAEAKRRRIATVGLGKGLLPRPLEGTPKTAPSRARVTPGELIGVEDLAVNRMTPTQCLAK